MSDENYFSNDKAQITVRDVIGFSMRDLMDQEGLTPIKLIRQLKKELKANTTKTAKLKGAVGTDHLGKGKRIIAESGVVLRSKDGQAFGDGETLIEWCEADMATRQKARMDAHKLRGDYPAEKNEIYTPDGILVSLYDAVKGKAGSLVNDPSKQ